MKSEPGDDDLLDHIAEATRGEKERSDKMAQIKGVSFSPDVSIVQREKDDFQVGKNTGLAAKMAELQLNHKTEIGSLRAEHKTEMGSLRAELNEIKQIFKTGFSNLAAVAANNAPPPAVQPVIPSTVVSPSVFSMGLSPDGTLSQPGLNPSNVTPASQSQPYVIPQMRNSSGGAPQPLMNNL